MGKFSHLEFNGVFKSFFIRKMFYNPDGSFKAEFLSQVKSFKKKPDIKLEIFYIIYTPIFSEKILRMIRICGLVTSFLSDFVP